MWKVCRNTVILNTLFRLYIRWFSHIKTKVNVNTVNQYVSFVWRFRGKYKMVFRKNTIKNDGLFS